MRVKKEILYKTTAEIVGEEANVIINYLNGKKDISEFKISQDLDIEIHLVRNIMYRLNSELLATYIRKKDKIKGWYISYWSLNLKRFVDVYDRLQKERVEKLKSKLEKEQEYREGLYICPNLCNRMNFEKAMEREFRCNECGSVLNQQDNSRTIEHLKEMIKELEAVAY